MPARSQNELIQTATEYTIDHDCPYAERLLRRTTPTLGHRGLALATLDRLVADLATLHTNSECPPTHVGPTSPTLEWSEWVKDTNM